MFKPTLNSVRHATVVRRGLKDRHPRNQNSTSDSWRSDKWTEVTRQGKRCDNPVRNYIPCKKVGSGVFNTWCVERRDRLHLRRLWLLQIWGVRIKFNKIAFYGKTLKQCEPQHSILKLNFWQESHLSKWWTKLILNTLACKLKYPLSLLRVKYSPLRMLNYAKSSL